MVVASDRWVEMQVKEAYVQFEAQHGTINHEKYVLEKIIS